MNSLNASDEQPPEALLKLKAKELLTRLLVNPGNQTLSAYLYSRDRAKSAEAAASRSLAIEPVEIKRP